MKFGEGTRQCTLQAGTFFVSLVAFVLFLMSTPAEAQFGGDQVAPTISNIRIVDIAEDSVTITWETDEDADSLVNYGLSDNYGIVRDPLPDSLEHLIILDELDPSTTYHFRVVSTDADGNQTISGDFKFTTEGLQDIEGLGEVETREEQAVVEQAVEAIQQIETPEAVEVVQEIVQQQTQAITDELTIVGPPKVQTFTDRAIISWTTDREASSCVNYALDEDFNPISLDRYTRQQCDLGPATQEHVVEVVGLEPATAYHFQVESTDAQNITGLSPDFTFTTKAILPEIENLHLLKVEETAATLAWNTTIPAKALVEFEDLETGEKRSVGSAQFVTDHQIRLADLTLGTQYRATVIAENVGGDRVVSDPITFVTVRDEEPPIISNVTNESTLFPGDEVRIQTIISWQTDEPAICDLNYREGLAPGVDTNVIPAEDIENFLERHVQVVVEFNPSTVYKFWLVCTDPSGNQAESEDFVLFTPTKEKSIIDIIIENFEATFGWVKNLGI